MKPPLRKYVEAMDEEQQAEDKALNCVLDYLEFNAELDEESGTDGERAG